MKKVLIFLMISMYIFGNFSTAFADSRSHNRQFKQKYKSGSGGHKQKSRQSRGKASHADKPQAVQKHRSGPRFNKTQPRQNLRRGPRVQQPHVVQKRRSAPHVQKPGVVQQHRSGPRVQQPRVTQRHRPDRRVYGFRDWRRHRPFPRVRYGHRHPYGHRVHILPYGFISFSIGGLIYYYGSGNYYRDYGGYYAVVTPPIGALITVPPPGYRIVYIDSHPYYLAGGVYYIWDDLRRGYRVVPPPEVINETNESSEELPNTPENSLDLFVYPNAGQSENEQANDRYDCHLWAVGETDFDPNLEESSFELEHSEYKRAVTACLEARDYTVK